jgi:hypothetical protein
MFYANEIYYLSCQEASLPSLGSVDNLAVECFLVISFTDRRIHYVCHKKNEKCELQKNVKVVSK